MSDQTICVEHARFGALEVREDEIYHFGGLPGFPGADRFVLMRSQQASMFMWLVSLDVPELGFAVMDPTDYFPDYLPRLSSEHLKAVDAKAVEEIDVLAIASVRPDDVVVNLAAPLVVNAGTRRGRQVILEKGDYSTRQPILLKAPPPAASAR